MASAWLIDMGYVVGASPLTFKIDYLRCRNLLYERLGEQPTSVIFNSIDSKLGITPGLQAFYVIVKQSGFLVSLYEMEGGKQRMVDVAIASEAVWRASQAETVILTTGDIDFLPAINLITKTIGARLILFSYTHGTNTAIREAASEVWTFESVRKRIEKQ
ncbi:MAG TPA: NYN domain-containing protein [Blastocatellia bacterium]|nr:NYN domain-containing protein [Blastocatellia bacterium]